MKKTSEARDKLPIQPEKIAAPPVVSAKAVRMLWLGLGSVALLFAAEMVHYAVATHLSALDTIPLVAANHHPQCQEMGGPYNLRCPQSGFNSVTMICWEFQCIYGDPNLPVITEPMRKRHLAEDTEDAQRSLRVESPYSAGSKDWQRSSQNLLRGGITAVRLELPLDQRATTIPDAQLLVVERSLAVSRQIGQEWMKQHGY